ncbi:MAG: hypothetical protein M3Y87_27390 [Myxococcota bacterium]|nr:hypothetical protein [Myxococcota bacterium]
MIFQATQYAARASLAGALTSWMSLTKKHGMTDRGITFRAAAPASGLARAWRHASLAVDFLNASDGIRLAGEVRQETSWL